MPKVLAFDFGASSGRAIIGEYLPEDPQNGGTYKIKLNEIHRFINEPVEENGTLYWNFPVLFGEVLTALDKLDKSEEDYESIGIDTWGVDFGLIGRDGKLIEKPVHYRDKRTAGTDIMEEVFQIIPKEELYSRTGTQNLNINSIFQLYYLATREPGLLERTDKILFMPDLFVYMLTGAKNTEYTIASTTGLLNAKTRKWDMDIIKKLGIPEHIFCGIAEPGTVAGLYKGKKVIYIGGHDTASAELAVPAAEKDFIFISSGTWSLMGTEAEEPVIEKAEGFNFTNEGCFDGKIRLLKNISGLWLIQESRRQWLREGEEVTFASLEREALEAPEFTCKIDVDHEMFTAPGNIPERVREYCRQTNQKVPESRGEIMRCIYESLASKYKQVFEQLKSITDINYSNIYVVGGGTKDSLLCRFTADFCGVTVKAGPVEATATGNIAGQLISLGYIKDVSEARKIIFDSFDLISYNPDASPEC